MLLTLAGDMVVRNMLSGQGEPGAACSKKHNRNHAHNLM